MVAIKSKLPGVYPKAELCGWWTSLLQMKEAAANRILEAEGTDYGLSQSH